MSATRESRRRRLDAARLYLCTDGRRARGDLPEFIEAALRGGVDVIQLREKGLEAREEIALCELLADAAGRHGALCAVNDRADIARVVRPDVLHLGQEDLPVPAARSIVGPDVLIGRSTHTDEQVTDAATVADVDYFCVGPTWPTPTKPGRAAPGLPLLRRAAATATDRPWFAIGGIDEARLPEVIAAGARRVVVVRAITEADDPEAAAARLCALLAAAPLPAPCG